MYPIEVRRADERIAVAGEVAVALVVGDDKHDVRPRAGKIVSAGGTIAGGNQESSDQ
jgi:hypothetical protein